MFREFLSWLGCKINKILALLSIFVLTMLVSCAFGRTFSKEDIANFMLNSEELTTNVPLSSTIVNNVNNRMGTWQTLSDLTSTYEGYYAMGYSFYQHYFWFVYVTGSSNTYLQYAFRYTTGNVSPYGTCYWLQNPYSSKGNVFHTYKYDLINDTLTVDNSNDTNHTTFKWGSTDNYTFLYTDKEFNVYTSSIGPVLPAGTLYPNESIFNAKYITGEVWEFFTGFSNTVHLFGNDTFDYHLIDSRDYMYTVLGILQDSSFCTGAGYDIMAYNKSKDMWETVYDWGEYFTDSDPISNYFTTGDIDGIPTSSIKLRSNLIIADTIINFSFARGNSFADLDKQIDISFYVAGSHTVFSGDSVDYESTFSDPNYYNDYQYNVDGLVSLGLDDTLNDVNDNLSNGSEVPEIVSDYFGSSGEVAAKLGFRDYSGDNPYGNVYLTILEGVRQVLIGSGHVVLTGSIHGQTFTFDSDDFQNPSPAIKIFTTSLCVFLMVYTFWGLAFLWAHKLAEGDILGLKSVVRDTAGTWASIIKRF